MKAVIQRVSEASVTIEGNKVADIKKGLLVLIGIEDADNKDDINWLTSKIANLRIFPSCGNPAQSCFVSWCTPGCI